MALLRACTERVRPTVRLTIVRGNTTTFLSGKSGSSVFPPEAASSIVFPSGGIPVVFLGPLEGLADSLVKATLVFGRAGTQTGLYGCALSFPHPRYSVDYTRKTRFNLRWSTALTYYGVRYKSRG